MVKKLEELVAANLKEDTGIDIDPSELSIILNWLDVNNADLSACKVWNKRDA